MGNCNNGCLKLIIVILVIALLGLCIFIAYDKGFIFNNVENNNQNRTTYYMSDDDKYMLVLTQHERKYSNTKVVDNVSSMFILSIDQYYDMYTVTGTYEIKDNKLILSSESWANGSMNGCIAEACNNVVHGNYGEIIIDYTEETILFGNVNLLKD